MGINNEGLELYKKDYSVYVLRVEMKELGRTLRSKKDELNEVEKAFIENKITDIKSTLQLLKEKYGMVNVDLEDI